MNLLCTERLSGATDLDLKKYLTQIDAWADRVRQETERHQYRFKRDPAEFEHSEGFFRMLMLAVVLAKDYGVHYDPRRRGDPAAASVSDGFFADSRDVFLHGLLWPERRGTCSSLPVLHVAIASTKNAPSSWNDTPTEGPAVRIVEADWDCCTGCVRPSTWNIKSTP